MMRFRLDRRAVSVLLVVVLPVVLVVAYATGVVHRVPPVAAPRFASPSAPHLPMVPNVPTSGVVASPLGGRVNTPWFCGGAPSGTDGAGVSVVVVNPADAPLVGTITVYSDATQKSVVSPFEVPARGRLEQSLSALQPDGTMLSALVDIKGAGGFVEERVVSRGVNGVQGTAGTAVTACANDAAAKWYFADNYTLNGSTEQLTIANPFADEAIVDLTFSTNDGIRQPQALQGVPIGPHSVVVVTEQSMPKNEAVMALTVSASRGRVVAQRVQTYLGERAGFAVTLGTPARSSEWVFADGVGSDEALFERYTIYNPTDADVKVTSVLLGVTDPTFLGTRTDTIDAGGVKSFIVREFGKVPAGRHALVATAASASVVVEQAVTRPVKNGYVTSVSLGAPKMFETFTRWSVAVGPTAPAPSSLLALNLDDVDGTVTVNAFGVAGEVPIAGLADLALPANQVTAIDLTDPSLVGAPLSIVSQRHIVVLRLYARGVDLPGRSAALALPG